MSNTNVQIPYDPKTHKKCSGCSEIKLRSHFTNDKSKSDGKRSKCKGCQREWRKTNAESRREADKRYRNKPENRLKKYKRSASERGFSWELTKEEFMTFWQKPCTHCGSPIETIGLDRVDSSLPYRLDNVEPCCSKCNQMKSDWDSTDWYNHMEKIRKNVGGFVSGAKEYK